MRAIYLKYIALFICNFVINQTDIGLFINLKDK